MTCILLELTCRLAAIKYRSTKKNKIPSGGIITKNQGLVLAFMVFTFLLPIKMKIPGPAVTVYFPVLKTVVTKSKFLMTQLFLMVRKEGSALISPVFDHFS